MAHYRFAASLYSPGEFHPRIHRAPDPGACEQAPDANQLYSRAVANSLAAAQSAFARLADVVAYVEPELANRAAFGHALRHLLIIACTEVESGLRSVLAANGVHRDRYSTTDFVRLRDPMRLREWVVSLVGAPDFDAVAPFAGWTPDRPTQSLAWYDAYNSVKHDRENQFHQATLENAISAVAGVFVVLCAQFGSHHFNGTHRAPFVVVRSPTWDPSEYYVPPAFPGGHTQWTPRPVTL